MKTVVWAGSKNPAKIASVRGAFELFFDDVLVEGIEVASGISVQPFDDDTFIGAKNRVDELLKRRATNLVKDLLPDFVIGLEGGVASEFNRHFVFAVACIADAKGRIAFGQSGRFELPDGVVVRLKAGEELGAVMDDWTNEKDLKHRGGAVGLLTNGKIDRAAFNRDAVVLALSVLLHPKWNP
ncbi:MAG: inosine/xanthosine triphosphatase [Candidatus Diapherotrites archaeon]|nr:inosine/xanthosine triphosphatase [Candidatus Diapherotrites archaeon]